MTTLRTARLLLRPFRPGDLDAYAAIRADPAVMRYMPGGAVAAARANEDAARIIPLWSGPWPRGGYAPWAVERQADGALIGHLGLRHLPEFDHATEVLWLLARGAWGQGYATEGARAAIAWGFQVLGLPRIHAFALPENTASRAVMRRLGMHERGALTIFGIEALHHTLDPPDA